MRARHVRAVGAATALIAGLGVVSAAPASAAPSAGCAQLNGASGSGVQQVAWQSFPFTAGEQLSVTWSGLSDPGALVELYVPGNVLVEARKGAGSVTYVFSSDQVLGGNSSLGGGATGTWSITCGGPGLTSEDGSEPAPPSLVWVQAYGRTADGGCADGWSPSWQEWATRATGGWVCTRTVRGLG